MDTSTALSLLQLLSDKDEIRDALARYARGVDRVDVQTMRTAYHDGAYDDHGQFKGLAEEFIARPRDAAANKSAHHLLGQSLIDIHGDHADVETYFIYHGTIGTKDEVDRQLLMVGRYLDRFERKGGRWAISYRRVVLDLSEERDVFPPRAGAEAYAKPLRFPYDGVYHPEDLRAPQTKSEDRL